MKTKFIEEEVKYIGSQLAPHWIYKNYKIQGDAIVAFIGECKVDLTEMVDIEDVINNEPIYSKLMLSFITEQFGVELSEGVFRQRLLICIIKELLEERGVFVVRNGDDLMIDGKKLSVSIATKSVTSVLIHTGLNILSEGALVSASGLTSELGITDVKEFAIEVMHRYSLELEDIKNKIIEFCRIPKSASEILKEFNLERSYFRRHYLDRMLKIGELKRTEPDKPKSKNQKYYS